jgi:iron complex transport system ATP-binding protein
MSLSGRGVTFGYGRQATVLDLSLEVRPGECVALVGPNGAGKSTIVKLLSRVAKPWSGQVTLDGAPLKGLSRACLARKVAVVPQGGELPEAFRAAEIVMMGRSPHLGFLASETSRDFEVVEGAMRRTDSWGLRDRAVGELSGGERQRVVLARALAQEPGYLLLDEPTSHLDLHYQVEVLRHVREEVGRGLGALVVLHDLNLAARACDRMILLSGGRVVAEGSPADVVDERLLRRVYGPGMEVLTTAGDSLPVLLPRLAR